VNDLDYARQYFKDDVYAAGTTGIVIEEVSKQYAKTSLSLDARHMNAAGRVMGAVYTTMADFTFAVSANYDAPLTVTVQSSSSFLKAAEGNTLTAESKCVKDGGRSCVYDVTVYDEVNEPVLLMRVQGQKIYPKEKKTEEEILNNPDPFTRWK